MDASCTMNRDSDNCGEQCAGWRRRRRVSISRLGDAVLNSAAPQSGARGHYAQETFHSTHYAHTICDKFCGWEKWPDDALFRDRLNGEITADVLNETATLDGKPHTFSALGGIHDRLRRDLKDNDIDAGSLNEVQIELNFPCNRLPESPNPGDELHFGGRGVIVNGENIYEVPYKKSERVTLAPSNHALQPSARSPA